MIEHSGSGKTEMTSEKSRASATQFSVTVVNEHNVQDVLQESLQKPLVLVFWSARSPDSETAKHTLQRLVSRFGGRIAFGTLDVDAHAMIAQQLGAVRVPVSKVVAQGQILAELKGNEPEEQLIRLFSQLGGEPGEEEAPATDVDGDGDENLSDLDRFLQTVDVAIQAGELPAAEQSVRQALQEEVNAESVLRLRACLAHVLILSDQLAEAKAEIDQLPDGNPERSVEAAWLFFATERQHLPGHEALMKRVKADGSDPEVRLGLAVYAALAGDFSTAQDHLFYGLRHARQYRDNLAQKALLALVDIMGPEHADTKTIRRQLFSLLH